MSDFVTRMVGAAKLQTEIYEEVEADQNASGWAAAVVALAAIASGIGSNGEGLFVWATIGAVVGWILWAVLTWVIGTKLLPEEQTDADINQVLRTMGFAASPGLLRIFGVVPGIGWLIVFIANIWMLTSAVIGVRQALDYKSTNRAIGVCLIGFILDIVIMGLIYNVLGPGAEPIAAHPAPP